MLVAAVVAVLVALTGCSESKGETTDSGVVTEPPSTTPTTTASPTITPPIPSTTSTPAEYLDLPEAAEVAASVAAAGGFSAGPVRDHTERIEDPEKRDSLASVFLDGIELYFEVYPDLDVLRARRTTMYGPHGTKYTSAACGPIVAYTINQLPAPDAPERARVDEVQTALSEVLEYC